jgi:GT2 family glycosyltransferase
MIDVITVAHNARNWAQAHELEKALVEHADRPYTFSVVDNRKHNRGFAPACNLGATWGTSPYIGFLNPDVVVDGAFLGTVVDLFEKRARVVICGERFGKAQAEVALWGCREWVCGAAMFVRRGWWEKTGGFDERYVWGWEETDLIREAQRQGYLVQALKLPLRHESPSDDTPRDIAFKHKHFDAGAKLFRQKWGTR